MSCSVIALPYALALVLCDMLVTGTTAVDEIGLQRDKNQKEVELDDITCEEVQVISEKHFIEKSFETPFMDKSLLLKTLTEHGVSGLTENEYGQIKCYVDHYELNFERTEVDKPYYIVIKALETDDVETKFNDLNKEYAVNVQEASYNSIVTRLQENNLQIENEEVCDDNTIVLTVNLE